MKSFAYDQKGFTSKQAALAFAVFGLVAAAITPTLVGHGGNANAGLVAAITGAGAGAGIDMTTTGSVRSGDAPKTRYVVRRSILQPDGDAPCIIYNSGRREGNC